MLRQTKTVRAQQNTCNAQSKEGETILSSHKKGYWKNKQTSVRSHRNGTVPEKTIMSSHKKGTAPNQPDCCVISQERSLNRQRPQTKLSQQIAKCEWISGILSQHVAWLCDARFLSQGVLYLAKRGQAVLKKDIQTFFSLPWRLDPFCTMGDDPRQARSCSSEFCP